MMESSPQPKDDVKSLDSYHAKSAGAFNEEHAELDAPIESYGPPGIRGLFSSPFVAFCSAFAAVGGLLFGYDQGVISVTLVMEHFLDRFPEVSDNASGAGFKKGLMTAMITLGAFIGAVNQGWLADWASRKRSIMVAVVVFTIGSVIQTAAVNYDMLVAGRFIGGMGIGMLSMVVPLYIGEIAPPEIRGSLLVFEALFVVLGIVIAFWITYGTRHYSSNWSWQIPFMLQIFPGIILGFGAWFLPFSPRWLASKDREDEALASLVKLRRLPATDSRVQREWMEIIAEARFQAGVQAKLHPTLANSKSVVSKIKLELAGWLDCFGAGCWRRTLVGVGLMFFQQFIGINALIYYSPTLFGTMGLDLDMQLIMSGILNILQLAGVFTSVWTIDRFGRKPMLLIGSVVALICLVIITILVATYSDDWASHRVQGWTSVGLLLFYMLGFGASWTSIPWAVPAEVFPSSLRAKGVSISTCSNWINNFIIGLITPPLVQNTGYGAYIFFAVFCLLSFVYVWFFVPETRGCTLEKMDEVFKDNRAAHDIELKTRTLRAVYDEKRVAQGA